MPVKDEPTEGSTRPAAATVEAPSSTPPSTPPPSAPPGDGDGTGTPRPSGGKKPRSLQRTVFEWVILLGGALVIALLIKTFLFQAFYIPSESMLPTLEQNDRVLVNKLSYKVHDVNRGDIVVFEAPEGEEGAEDLVKRVVALPGENVSGCDNGKVCIDNRRLDEPYLAGGTTTSRFPTRHVPADTVFVMGDNRSFSKDSRSFGPIDQDTIVGRVFVRIWPPNRLGLL
ncbi:MAG: signal peptidase I [Acidimicrobiia bacterium]